MREFKLVDAGMVEMLGICHLRVRHLNSRGMGVCSKRGDERTPLKTEEHHVGRRSLIRKEGRKWEDYSQCAGILVLRLRAHCVGWSEEICFS